MFLWNIIFLSVKSKLVDIKILAESHTAAVQGERFAVNLLCTVLSSSHKWPNTSLESPELTSFIANGTFENWGIAGSFIFFLGTLSDALSCSVTLTVTLLYVEHEAQEGAASCPTPARLCGQMFPGQLLTGRVLTHTASSSELGSCKGHMRKTYLWCCWPSEFYSKFQNCIGWTLWHCQFF